MDANPIATDDRSEELSLVASIAAGDTRALATIYDRYAGLLMALGLKVLGDRAEVEDLLHDVFVEVWQKAGSYDPARGSVRTWLCLRMRSRALDRTRLSRRTRNDSLGDSDAEERMQALGAEDPTPTVIERERLKTALAELPDSQRKVISLAYFKGLSCSEIAQFLSLPIGTVKSRLAGARRGLERAMTTQPGATQ